MPKLAHFTCTIKETPPSQPYIDPSIQIEFYRSGEFVEMRAYFPNQTTLIGTRISNWITWGILNEQEQQ